MTTDQLLAMIKKFHEEGKTPRTIVMSQPDFESLNIPKWTKQLFGLKLVVAANMPKTFISDHFYETVGIKKVDQYDLNEYRKEKLNVRH